VLFGEAGRIMPQDEGVVSRKLLLHLDARGAQETKLLGVVSRERFLDAEDGKACRTLAAGPHMLCRLLLLSPNPRPPRFLSGGDLPPG
jgi:hypothetical protein